MEKIVFTNGCFDILHPGHLSLLKRAKELGTKLVIGLNSDRSVRAIKGIERPINSELDRKTMLESLRFVDEVRIFDETTPEQLIRELKPHVLVKGGDWQVKEIVGAEFVVENGGQVFTLPTVEGFSTTRIIEKMKIDRTENVETSGGNFFNNSLNEHLKVFNELFSHQNIIESCAELLIETFKNGRQVLICGNGGSAADAQHIAAEFVGRYENRTKSVARRCADDGHFCG